MMNYAQRVMRSGLGPDFEGAPPGTPLDCDARTLYRALFTDPENSYSYLQAAYRFVLDALDAVDAPPIAASHASAYATEVRRWAAEALPPAPARTDTPWAAMVAKELAPLGLADGAWLRGCLLASNIESKVGMSLLEQWMIRIGDPGTRESYAQRYADLLRSVGIVPDAVTLGWRAALCRESSYQHALLPVVLGHFGATFEPEIVGYNLWASCVGPCPLLAALREQLLAQGACVRYLDLFDRARLFELAVGALEALLDAAPAEDTWERVGRGVGLAAHAYRRWAASLVEIAGARAPGDVPPASAQQGDRRTPTPAASVSVSEADVCRAAVARYARLPIREQFYRFANADRNPLVGVFGRVMIDETVRQLSAALRDGSLGTEGPPEYSEQAVAEMVAERHAGNVSSRKAKSRYRGDGDPARGIRPVFDGCWVQGLLDVERSGFEEYGWLARIYASEHGDGNLAWNHCQIFRRSFGELGPDVMLSKRDPRLYDLFKIRLSEVATLAIAYNTRRFMPEILGVNLGIEAWGVAGGYMELWKEAEADGSEWKALAARLHNSIDNYAEGHTKWSLAAVQSYMRRVKDASPADVDAAWGRIWCLWRWWDLAYNGSKDVVDAMSSRLASLAG